MTDDDEPQYSNSDARVGWWVLGTIAGMTHTLAFLVGYWLSG